MTHGDSFTSLLCAEGACYPGHNLRALAVSVQRREGQDWGPSYCERSLGKGQDWGPASLRGRDPDQVRDPGAGCLPSEDLVLTWSWICCSWVSSWDLTEKETRKWDTGQLFFKSVTLHYTKKINNYLHHCKHFIRYSFHKYFEQWIPHVPKLSVFFNKRTMSEEQERTVSNAYQKKTCSSCCAAPNDPHVHWQLLYHRTHTQHGQGCKRCTHARTSENVLSQTIKGWMVKLKKKMEWRTVRLTYAHQKDGQSWLYFSADGSMCAGGERKRSSRRN